MEYFCLRDLDTLKLISAGNDEEVVLSDTLTSDQQVWYLEDQYIVNKAQKHVLTLRMQDYTVWLQPRKPKDDVWKGRAHCQFWEAQVHGGIITIRFKHLSGLSGAITVNKGKVCVSMGSGRLERIAMHDIILQGLSDRRQHQVVVQQNAQVQEAYSTLEEQHKLLTRQFENLQEQHSTLLDQRTALQQKNSALRTQVEAQKQLEEQSSASRLQVEQLQQQLQQQQTVIDQNREQQTALEQRYATLQSEYTNWKHKHRSQLAQSNAKLEQETLHNTMLQQKLDAAQQHRRALEIKLDTLTQQYNDLQSKVGAPQSEKIRTNLSELSQLPEKDIPAPLVEPASEAVAAANQLDSICAQTGINNLRKALSIFSPAQLEVLNAHFSVSDLENSLATTLRRSAEQFFSSTADLIAASVDKVSQQYNEKIQQLHQDKAKIVQILTGSNTASHVLEGMVQVMQKEIDSTLGLLSEWDKSLQEFKSLSKST